MTTRESSGNILEDDAEAVVNTVNCVGVMGKGIALQFRQAYPANYRQYAIACKHHVVRPGVMFTTETGKFGNPQYIINFPTKRHWRGKSRLEDIESGLAALTAELTRLNVRTVAVPALGCGNGGLDWEVVRPLIIAAFDSVPHIELRLYSPAGAPAFSSLIVRTEQPALTPIRAALLRMMQQYQVEGYRHSLLELQKLAYFLQVAGQSLRLRFTKAKYGPYAETLNHVLQRLEGHYIEGYGDRSRSSEITLTPNAVSSLRDFRFEPECLEQLREIEALIQGYETPYGLELLATVHWAATERPLAKPLWEDVARYVSSWNARKAKLFPTAHIRKAYERLESGGWLDRVA